jgi:hypothetical protein
MKQRAKGSPVGGEVSMTYSGHVREVGQTDAGDITALIDSTAGRVALRGLSLDYSRRLALLLYRPCSVTITITPDAPLSKREQL